MPIFMPLLQVQVVPFRECLKRCAYWISLADQPPTQNQETITVYIPRENIFTANVLQTMMQRITAGERL